MVCATIVLSRLSKFKDQSGEKQEDFGSCAAIAETNWFCLLPILTSREDTVADAMLANVRQKSTERGVKHMANHLRVYMEFGKQ